MNGLPTQRILVVGDDNVGKTTLIHALCGASSHVIGAKHTPGCSVSVRTAANHSKSVEEFYEIAGAPRFQHGRQVFLSQRRYDGVIFVHDVTDPSTRSSISCTWVPEVMHHLGDVGAIEAGGRLDGSEVHVRSAGVVNELKFLWRQTLFSHSGITFSQAVREAMRLSWRLVCLLLNEVGIWTDSSIDQEAETVFLATSLVPTLIVGMKSDLMDKSLLLQRSGNSVDDIQLHANSVAHDPRLAAFLRRVAETAKRKTPVQGLGRNSSSNIDRVMLGF